MRKIVLKLWLLFNVKRCRVSKIVTEYNKVTTFYLKPLGRFKYKSGQHTHLVKPDGKITREDVRHMTMASAPHEEELIFSMDLESESSYKKEMCAVNVGDKLKIYAAGGNITMGNIHTGDHINFIAGGLGMTAFRSIISSILHYDLPVSYNLIYAGKGYLYKDFLKQISDKTILTDRSGLIRSVKNSINRRSKYFICGRVSFVKSVVDILNKGGISSDRIFFEEFR